MAFAIQKIKRSVMPAVICAAFAAAIAVPGTMAYLTSSAFDVNVFSLGDVRAELSETPSRIDSELADDPTTESIENDYAIRRSSDGLWAPIAKDPVVTVGPGSVDCYVFAVLNESDNFDSYLEYSLADGWTPLVEGESAAPVVSANEGLVYWRMVETSSDSQAFPILAGAGEHPNGVVTVKSSVSDAQVREMGTEGNPAPSLAITVYAVQASGSSSAFEAWGLLSQ